VRLGDVSPQQVGGEVGGGVAPDGVDVVGVVLGVVVLDEERGRPSLRSRAGLQPVVVRAARPRRAQPFLARPGEPDAVLRLSKGVARAVQRTHTEEFYEVWDLTWAVGKLSRKLRAWERSYNTVRPHQSLGYQTPQQFLHDLARASP
jgi:hypothetical protein